MLILLKGGTSQVPETQSARTNQPRRLKLRRAPRALEGARPAPASPSSTRSGTSGQENPAHDNHPHDADEGREEPRIGAVRRPESIPHPRGTTQQDEYDAC